MIRVELMTKAKTLLSAIAEAGVVSLVEDNHAHQTLVRIVDTGTSLPGGTEEDTETTEQVLEVFSDPTNWGWVSDRTRQQEWMDFCSRHGY